MLMVSVSGIRGIIGTGLTPDVAAKYASSYGTFIGSGTIVVGRDSRISGPLIQQAVMSGLQAVGCHVLDIGVAATPTVPMIMEQVGAQGGIAVTASHNPAEWNALKMFAPDGLFLDADQGQEVARIYEGDDPSFRINYAPWDQLGEINVIQNPPEEEHVSRILKLPYLDVPALRKRNFQVALDTVNGAGGRILPHLLQELGCDVTKLNSEMTGIFAHTPEPLPENLTQISELMQSREFDIGFVSDPDVDRLAVIDETGRPIGEEKTLYLAADFMLKQQPTPLVANVSSTRALDDLARQAGVPIYRTPVGEVHVAKKMREVDAAIGGEGNGGVILADLHLGRDAMVGVALILQHLMEKNEKISALADAVPAYFMRKTKIPRPETLSLQELENKLRQKFTGADFDLTDGIKINQPAGWVQIRFSNTEPIVRIFAEAETSEKADELVSMISALV